MAGGKGPEGLDRPTGLCVWGENLVLCDSCHHRLCLFGRGEDGRWQSVSTLGRWGLGREEFRYPTAVCRAENGALYVADSLNNAVKRLSVDGGRLRVEAVMEAGGMLRQPRGVWPGPPGMLWVACQGDWGDVGRGVHCVSLTQDKVVYTLPRPQGLEGSPYAVCAQGGTVYVTHYKANALVVYEGVVPPGDTAPRVRVEHHKGMEGPRGLCVDQEGRVLVAAEGGVWVLSPSGSEVLHVVRDPRGEWRPWGVAVHHSALYVLDKSGNRVVEWVDM